MTPVLTYIGRVLSLTPATAGEQFEDVCTIQKRVVEQASADNGWKRRTIIEPIRCWWREPHHETGAMTWWCLSGFGPRIEHALKGNLEVRNLLSHGLPTPDFDAVQYVQWRGSQAEVFMRLLTHDRGVIDCSTGYGKTMIIGQLARVYPDSKIVIVVDGKDIVEEIYKGIKMWEPDVGMLGGGHRDLQRVTVSTPQSVKYADTENTNLLLGDECHTLVTPVAMQAIGAFRRAKIFGFSASPRGRHDNTDGLIEALFGPVIAQVQYAEAVAMGNVVPITVKMITNSTGPTGIDGLRDADFESAAIWNNLTRNRLLALVNRMAVQDTPDEQILTMVSKTEHAFRLGQLLPEYIVVHGDADADKVATLQERGAFIAGQRFCTPTMRKQFKADFETRKALRAIATSVWSKGVNFQDLAYLVRGDGVASSIQSTQVPGRLSRLGTNKDKEGGVLYDIYDEFSPRLKVRSQKRIAEYKRHGWKVERISV